MESPSITMSVRHQLSLCTRFAFSVGHVLNDVCASMWFTYMLVYLHFVLELDNVLAGALLLVGQVADALATPFVGFESDRIDDFWLCRYGRRKTWHLFGTICVLCSFPFLFMECLGCANADPWARIFYYSAFVIIFQFGWASVQISHLSMIPDLTTLSCERVELNSYRYAFTVISNICVYGIAWVFLGMETDNLQSEQVGPQDKTRFRNTMLSVIAIGSFFVVVFHIFVKEKPANYSTEISRSPSTVTDGTSRSNLATQSFEVSVHLRWKDWFKESQFYKIGLLYMSTRLYVNLSQVYIPLYLQDSLGLHRKSIAIIPLVVYVSGFVASFIVNFSNKKAGPKVTYFVSCFIAIGACIWIYFGNGNDYKTMYIYVVAVLIGVASSSMLITSLTITSDLIGHNTSSGAFVFGSMSFLDKLSNGLAVMIIQKLHPCTSCCAECKWYYGFVLTFACGAAVISALIAIALLAPYALRASTRTVFIQSCNDSEQRHGISRKYLTHAESVDDTNGLYVH